MTITVDAANDAPVANGDNYNAAEDTPLVIVVPGVLGNDTDVDGNPLTAAVVTAADARHADAEHGRQLHLHAGAELQRARQLHLQGERRDGGLEHGDGDDQVGAVNDAPVATGESYGTAEDTPLTVAAPGVLGNDSDVDGTPLTAAVVTPPTHGTLTLNTNGSFTYTPALNYNGPDSFAYKANDGTADSNTATVTITVGAANDAPAAAADSYATAEDTLLTIAAPGVVGNDTDVDSASLTAVLVSGPANGTLTFNADGSFSYAPNANFNGSDSFSYRANDGALTSAAAVVSITVNAVNDPPVVSAGPDRNVVFPAAASLAGTVVDIDGPALVRVWSQVSGPGTAMFADPNAAATTATFTVAGTYVLRLTANDGQFTVSDDVSVVVGGSNNGLRLDGVSKRVTFGPAPGLGAATFTIETWFKREGPGVSLSTGTGGLPAAIPLVTKGRGEADGSNLDMNYFLGINGTTRVLVADFEDAATGLNHPVQGVTAICDNVWYHAAATYDGTTWRLYLNGQLETTLVVGAFTPRADSIQHGALGTAMTSTGAAAGFFQGVLDEARVWNFARNAAAIQATMTGPLPSASGLIGRWSVDEGSGSTIADSSGGGNTGTIVNTAVWVTGTPYVSTPLPPGSYGLRMTGSATDAGHVKLGAAPGLNAATFTVEAWVRRETAGVATNTGSGGIIAIPLVTKGMAETEGGTVDMNYFLGIRQTDNLLVADFEDAATGLNHPVAGVTPIPANGVWHHVAATYDGTTWRLYLDGVLETQLLVGAFTPQFNSIQHAAIGSALNSTGGIGSQTQGFFGGVLDEVRIWNLARSGAQILTGRDQEIASAAGLLGRWGFNDSCGGVLDSSGNGNNGTLSGANCTFVAGAPFASTPNTAPVVNAGPDQPVALPAVAALAGTATDDGLPGVGLTTTWSKVSGPGTVTFGNASALVTTATFSTAGTYVLRLTASDSLLSTSDDLTITVSGAGNQAPVVNAGLDQAITLPINQISLAGTATDDGLPSATLTTTWSKTSGIGTVTFGNASALSTTASFSVAGTYVLRLTASDGPLSPSDELTVIVTGVTNLAPVVNAGVDQTITLPINQISLAGTATDDGLPSATLTTTWSKVSGPGTVTFGSATSLSTTATFSAQGSYVLQLTASDGLLSASDTMSVTVAANPANKGLDFGGTNAYVTFGAAPGLGVSTLTIETWFRRDGTGIATNTGTGGVVAIPLVTKGMAETEGGPVDMNYFLGIRSSDNVLVADFEDMATGLNHPVAGTTRDSRRTARGATRPRRMTARPGGCTSTARCRHSSSSGRSRRASTAFSTPRSARR